MTGPVAIAAHSRAGRVEPTRLAARVAGPSTAPATAPFGVGRARLGALEIEVGVETAGEIGSLDWTLCNAGDAEVFLESAILQLIWRDAGAAVLRAFCHGGRSDSACAARDLGPEGAGSELVGVVGSPDGPACLVGALERGRAFAQVFTRPRDGAVEIEVALRVGAVLAPGERCELEMLRVALGGDAVALLEAYAEDYGRRAGARATHPFTAIWSCSPERLHRDLDVLSGQQGEHGFEVVQIDRALAPAADLADLARAIGAAGLTPGLRLAPFGPAGDGSVLDAGRDDGAARLEETARGHVAQGFRHLELASLADGAAPPGADAGLAPATRLRRALAALRAGAGDEVFLLGAASPLGPAVGLLDGMRLADPLARSWMHRRLWVNAPDVGALRSPRARAAALASGGLALVEDDVAALPGLAPSLALAREIDNTGVPGGARSPALGSAPALFAPTPEGAIRGHLNLGAEARRIALEAESGADLEPLLDSPPWTRELAPGDAALYRLSRAFSLAVFCDFDGTFSVQDVGSTLAERHAGARRPVQWARYERGEITAWEYNLEILDGLEVSLPTLEAFLATVDLDPGAKALVAWCAGREIPFRILSDGFDYNLNRLQRLHGVRFAHDANHLRYDAGRWRIRAGHPNPDCSCGTGTCKRGRIETFRARHPGAALVHIGNGRVSDLCGALAADLAFAKGSLAAELRSRGEAFEPFATLHDVVPILERRLASGALQRRSA